MVDIQSDDQQGDLRMLTRALLGLFSDWAVTDLEARTLLGNLSNDLWESIKGGEVISITPEIRTRMGTPAPNSLRHQNTL